MAGYISDEEFRQLEKKINALQQRRDAQRLASGEGIDFARSYALDDIEVVRGGTGREVVAYCAVFDAPYEVQDAHGHYYETIHRSAFDRRLATGKMPMVLYNHGADLTGRPDTLAQVPLGTALEVRPDHHGLLTRARYNKTPLAESVLEAIRHGDIKSQSFRGKIYRSTPDRVPRSTGGGLPSITRNELGLSDFGPTPSAVNAEAKILAVRARSYRYDEDDEPPIRSMADLRRKIRAFQIQQGWRDR